MNRKPSKISTSNIVNPSINGRNSQDSKCEHVLPVKINRYRVKERLGSGSFGEVFLAADDQLQRHVAIKVPRKKYLADPSKSHQYLAEAQLIAELDHPNIVPIYDVGSSNDFPCYIVTKFIDGEDLAKTKSRRTVSALEAIQLTIDVARALHFAHCRGITHRDIKPENILLDSTGKPFVADLGLAVRDSANNKVGITGTPAYMSPEQARGEGHRVDGRSDIFSLGVVLYELLVGKLPFAGSNSTELLESIANSEPKPLRQIEDSLPIELERICMKAISHRTVDRYTTAQDFAGELQLFLDECEQDWNVPSSSIRGEAHPSTRNSARRSASSGNSTVKSNNSSTRASQLAKIIPKGIRSFDGHDADFFLNLLQGPYDRNGLPAIVRFWKSRIESSELAATCPLGVLYGPSGCGKTSLMRAGILPLLNDSVVAIFVEATGERTVEDLKKKLMDRFKSIPNDASIDEIARGLRNKQYIQNDKKVLLIFDQFEQWIDQAKNLSNETFLNSLRQCDGKNLQSIFLVRDEFWLGLTRLAEAIEVELSEDRNTTCLDKFPLDHAVEVLRQFGVAYGKLPGTKNLLNKKQRAFLQSVVDQLEVNGRVESVKISLVAELIKDTEWSSHSLQEIGGISGLGVAYLKQNLDDSNLPSRRAHADSARRILAELLPGNRSNIKGPAKSEEQLASIAQYEHDSQRFEELIQLLDSETKLISLTDNNDTERHFQISHDYLIPSIREWSESHQKNSPEGRAKLLLNERSDVWNAQPGNQRLPSTLETIKILKHTLASQRSVEQNQMLKAAKKLIFTRAAVTALLVAIASTITWSAIVKVQQNAAVNIQENREKQAQTLIHSMESIPLTNVVFAAKNLEPYQSEAIALISQSLEASTTRREKLIRLSLLETLGVSQQPRLLEMLDNATNDELSLLLKVIPKNSEQALSNIDARFHSAKLLTEKARFAVISLDLGNPKKLETMLQLDDDETDRSHAIVSIANWDHNWNEFTEVITSRKNPGVISGVLLGMSLCEPETIAYQQRDAIIQRARTLFANHPSANVHSAAGKLLSQWGVNLPIVTESPPSANWKVTSKGITLVRISAGVSKIREIHNPRYRRAGAIESPKKIIDSKFEGEYPVKNAFWIADREISKGLFYQFLNDFTVPAMDRISKWDEERAQFENQKKGINRQAPSDDHPINKLCMQDAILFCNWLSRKEGLEPVYTRTGNSFAMKNQGEYSYITSLLEWESWNVDYQKSGYRLPTFPEFSLARIGETENLFSFGDDLFLTDFFANVSPANPHPIKLEHTIKCTEGLPNRSGIHNLFGNVAELAHAAIHVPETPNSPEWWPELVNQQYMVVCGADMKQRRTRTSFRTVHVQSSERRYGFRVVRKASE